MEAWSQELKPGLLCEWQKPVAGTITAVAQGLYQQEARLGSRGVRAQDQDALTRFPTTFITEGPAL